LSNAVKNKGQYEYRSREKNSPDHRWFLPFLNPHADQRTNFVLLLRKKRANNKTLLVEEKTFDRSAE
jgi:hypothetical protein